MSLPVRERGLKRTNIHIIVRYTASLLVRERGEFSTGVGMNRTMISPLLYCC